MTGCPRRPNLLQPVSNLPTVAPGLGCPVRPLAAAANHQVAPYSVAGSDGCDDLTLTDQSRRDAGLEQGSDGISWRHCPATNADPVEVGSMADSFVDQLRAELDAIQAELDRLAAKRNLIDELLSVESGAAAGSDPAQPASRRAARRPAAGKRPRRPRGLITGKVREFLGPAA